MTKPRVLVLGNAVIDSEHYENFCKYVEPVVYRIESREKFMEDLDTKLNDIQGMWFAQNGIFSHAQAGLLTMNQEFISHLPPSLKVIAVCSIGYDRYDVKALYDHGVILCNTPALASDQVADTALYHVLNCFRHYNFFDRLFRLTASTGKARALANSKILDEETGFPIRPEEGKTNILAEQVNSKVVRTPRGHVAGIVGLGAIGQELLKRLHSLGMIVHYTKRKPLTELEKSKLGDVPLHYHETFESLLPISDVLVFCVPLNAQTKHMLNEDTIAQCKDGVRVVNIGRGATIDEVALLKLLKSGKVGYAGLDVFENEPNVSEDVAKRYDISVTPHIGSSTLDNRILSSEHCQANVLNVLIDGGEGLTPIHF